MKYKVLKYCQTILSCGAVGLRVRPLVSWIEQVEAGARCEVGGGGGRALEALPMETAHKRSVEPERRVAFMSGPLTCKVRNEDDGHERQAALLHAPCAAPELRGHAAGVPACPAGTSHAKLLVLSSFCHFEMFWVAPASIHPSLPSLSFLSSELTRALSLSPTCLSKQSCCFHINFYDLCFEEGAWECSLIRSWHNSPLTSICALLLAAPGQYIQRLWWESAGPRWSSGGGWHRVSRQESPFQDGRHLPYHEQRALHLLFVHSAHIPPFIQPALAPPPPPPPPQPPDPGGGSARPHFLQFIDQRHGCAAGSVGDDHSSPPAPPANGSLAPSHGHGPPAHPVGPQRDGVRQRRGVRSQRAGGVRGEVQAAEDKARSDPGGCGVCPGQPEDPGGRLAEPKHHLQVRVPNPVPQQHDRSQTRPPSLAGGGWSGLPGEERKTGAF